MRKKLIRKKSSEELSREIKEVTNKSIEKKEEHFKGRLISTGSTVLNCALSDNPLGGYCTGKLSNLIGDSNSGKTLLALTMLADAAENDVFNNYKLIYDDAEQALEFNLEYLFGEKIANRIITDTISDTIYDWYSSIYRLLKKEESFIYVLDSLDSLTSLEEQKRAEKIVDGKLEKGSYGGEKPKMISEIIRNIVKDLKKTESFVLVVSQTRDNIGVTFGSKKTRSGGRALKFYCCHEIWLAVAEKLKRREREVGISAVAKVSKNKLTGKVRKVWIPMFYDYGIDDVGANVTFLINEGIWEKKKQTINAVDLGIEGTYETLIKKIEEGNMENDLKMLIGKVWNKIEESIKSDRKKRYQ
jgi:recombination protein RecA